jgi:hypothetical protein
MDIFKSGFRKVLSKHVAELSVGKRDGCLSLQLLLESYRYSDLFEILNADIIPDLETAFGKGCVTSTQSYTDVISIITHTNYLMENGRVSKNISAKKHYVGE